MAFIPSALGSALWNAVKGQNLPTNRALTDAESNALWTAIATEILNHIKNNGSVSVSSVSGVMSGPSASGPGSGTIS